MKKQPNEFDDFLRSKEDEFNIPFKEEYWEQASAYLQANRTTGFWTSFFQKFTWWGSGIALLIIGSIATYYFVGYQQQTMNTTTLDSPSTIKNPALTKQDAKQMDNKSGNELSASENTIAITTKPEIQETKSNPNQSSLVSDVPPISIDKGTSSSASKPNKKSKDKSSASNTSNYISSNTTNSTSYNLVSINSLQTKSLSYFKQSGIPSIPVFEEMTINDNTIPVFYGLPYQSDVSGNSSRKIREFSRGGLYPQLTVSLSGGVNVFNAFKEYAKEPGFISTNPYLGLKATYQINTLWILGAQINAIQRGGVNQQIHYLENPENDIMLKQFYAVQLPFSVGYFLNKKNSVSLGVAPMYTLATKFSTYDLANQQLKKSTQFLNTKGLNVFDLQLSAGYTYRLNKKVNLHASYYFGLIDATKSNTFTNDLRHTNHFLNIGINYNLLQKKVNLR